MDNESGEEEKDSIDVAVTNEVPTEHGQNGSEPGEDKIVQLLPDERDAPPPPPQIGNMTNRYEVVQQVESEPEDGSLEVLPQRLGTPPESIMSSPDNTPSVQVRLVEPFVGHRLTSS